MSKKNLQGVAHHWAVQVDDNDWYEIKVDKQGNKNKYCTIAKSYGRAAESGAGQFGGEYVGETDKTDEEIEDFNRDWETRNPRYEYTSINCQKYAIEFIK